MDRTKELLELIAGREADSRWGIGVAAQYLKSLEPCFDGDQLCIADAFSNATADQWLQAVKEANSRAVFCDDDLLIDIKSISKTTSIANAIMDFDHVVTTTRKDRDGDILECAGGNVDERMPLLWQHIPLQPLGPYCGTSTKTDSMIAGKSAILDTSLGRDAAVLVEGGALRISQGFKAYEFEPLLRKDAKDTKPYGFRIKRFDIMEVSLVSIPSNEDAVITAFSRKQLGNAMVKSWAKRLFDARRTMSPGADFTNKEHACGCSKAAEPEAKKDLVAHELPTAQAGAGSSAAQKFLCPTCNVAFDFTTVPDGMDLTKITCPVCSKPIKATAGLANKAGKVLAKRNYDRIASAHTALAECLADHDKGDTEGSVDNDSNTNRSKDFAKRFITRDELLGDSPRCANKTFGAESDYVDGSFQWISDLLNRSADVFLRSLEKMPRHSGYCYVAATFPEFAVVCCQYSSEGDYKRSCYRIGWSMEEGRPKFSGEATEVRIETSVVEKLFAPLIAKEKEVEQSQKGMAVHSAMISAMALDPTSESGIEKLDVVLEELKNTREILAGQQVDDPLEALVSG